MKLHIVSDLHIEYSNYPLPVQDADVLILAGDIGNGLTGLTYASQYKKDYKHIIYVPGNHEFYGHHLSRLSVELKQYSKSLGIIILDNDTVQIEDVVFIGSTLWTDFRLYGDKLEQIGFYMNKAMNGINDFSQIRYAHWWFQPSNCASLSIVAQSYIKNKLIENKNLKKVVISHHSPSLKSVHEKYLGNQLNPAFANDLDELINLSDFWIHGHTHDSFDYLINKSRVICNPRGYSKYEYKQENESFNPKFCLEV
ncbi:metallophosphoesterase [archaeon]|nr:metallophosphoesterase [archaeon]NCQ50438.1 metallophosphoesterase [archaeon]